MTTTEKLTEWAVQKIKNQYPDDIALLVAVEGHSVNGDGHGACFDYFVPANEKGVELGQTFIIDGIGYDLYPRSWERTENTANLDDYATLCLGKAKILYSRTEEDKQRFVELQAKLNNNLLNKAFVYQKALNKLDTAMDLYRRMMFEDALYKVRMAAGYIADYLSTAVAFLNGTFLREWSKGQLQELSRLKEIPENFIEYYKAIVFASSSNELKSIAHLMISTFRRFMAARKPERTQAQLAVNFADLANWYQELSLTWRRLRYFCDNSNYLSAFTDACHLQNELTIVQDEFGLQEMDLLSCFDPDNLTALKDRSSELEQYVVSEIENHGVKLNQYDSVEDFLAHN